MVTGTTDPSILAAKPKHFLVKREDGTIFLVAEIERFPADHPDYRDASALYDEGYARKRCGGTPVKPKQFSSSAESLGDEAKLAGGAITLHFQAGD